MNVMNFVYVCLYLVSFVVCYFIILETNFERVFKQGRIWQIRAAQAILALIIAYFLTLALVGLIEHSKFF